MENSKLTEQELADLARRWSLGDKEAFSKLYDTYVNNLYRFVYFKVNSIDAEDLTELTFLKAWEARKRYDPKKSSFSSWIYTIARNTIIDHYRVHRENSELDVNLVDGTKLANPKLMAEESMNSKLIREAVKELSPNYRDIVLLKFIDDLDYSEIAHVLGKSEGAIRVMQFRALRDLRKILEKKGFTE